jgi:twitching motility protein PilT
MLGFLLSGIWLLQIKENSTEEDSLMTLEDMIRQARKMGASDLHLEPGLPPAHRIRGKLKINGDPFPAADLQALVQHLLGETAYQDFLVQRSYDLARTIGGVRCRINVLTSIRGTGLAVRLLPTVQPTVETLNLHPEIKKIVQRPHGLILLSGPTGCGKSSTMAAMLEELNRAEPLHIITIESPIEYLLRPRKAFIRQREVGRDTPSFEQGLLDALREDPDVIMVGEMRDPACMRLTLNAAETGHLVLTTVHSSNVAEALQRVILAFPAEIQAGISAQLADCLAAVVCQKLRYLPEHNIQIPECEILLGNSSARSLIRTGQFFKIQTVLETSGNEGMWSLERYRDWINKRSDWRRPTDSPASEETEEIIDIPARRKTGTPNPIKPPASTGRPQQPLQQEMTPEEPRHKVLVINEPEENFKDILSQLEKK